MNLIINHTIRSARHNLGQILVIVVAVALATAMLFAAFSMSDIFYNINMIEYSRTAQGADMLVGSNSADGVQFSRSRIEKILGKYSDDIEYIEYFLKLGTVLNTDSSAKAVQVEATDLQTYFSRHKIGFVQEDASELTELKDIVISQSFAKEAGLVAGDDVEIYLATYDINVKLNVLYIAENEGIFSSETAPNVLVDLSAIGSRGQVSAVYVKFNSGVTDVDAKIEEIKTAVQEELPQVSVGEGDGESTVRSIASQNTLLFTVGLIFIVGMMMLILLTSYQIIARHRMGEMITFKAVGATPLQTAGIMLVEVGLYGAIGAGFGLLLGRLAMQIAVNSLLPMATAAVTYDVWKYVVAYALGVVVTIISALVPIITTSKKTIRELSDSEEKATIKKENPILCGVSLALVIAAAVAVNFMSGTALLVMAAVILVLLVLAVKFSVGYVIKGIGFLAGKIFKTGPQKLATIGTGRNKAMRTVTILIATLIAFSFMVVEVVDLVKTAVQPSRSRYDCDVVAITASGGARTTYGQAVSAVSSIDGVEECGYFNSKQFKMSDDFNDEDSFTIYGVSDYMTLTMCTSGELAPNAESLWKTEDFPLVVSRDMSLRKGWEVGDKVKLISKDEDYKDTVIEFTIVGIDETYTEWDLVGYCKFELLESKFQVLGATYLIKTDGSANNVFNNIRDYFDSTDLGKCYVLPFEEWAYAGKTVLTGVGTLLTILQVAIYVVSVLGVFNIAVVTVFDRKKEIALYKLTGMSESDYRKYSLTEGVLVGVSGGGLGIVLGVVLNRIIPVMGTLIEHYMDYGVFPASVGITAVIGCVFFSLIWALIAILNKNIRPTAINERFK